MSKLLELKKELVRNHRKEKSEEDVAMIARFNDFDLSEFLILLNDRNIEINLLGNNKLKIGEAVWLLDRSLDNQRSKTIDRLYNLIKQ